MKAVKFRVQNYRNIDDSGWIQLDQVTAFVGRNESGKTALLKALHKFNPGTPEPYDALREFPRDRYTSDYVANGSRDEDWPVCSVSFAIPTELQDKISDLMNGEMEPPSSVTLTRYYDGALEYEYDPEIPEMPLSPQPVVEALDKFRKQARSIVAPDEETEDTIASIRNELISWATESMEKLKVAINLRDQEGARQLSNLRSEVESKSKPLTAEIVGELVDTIEPMIDIAEALPIIDHIEKLIDERLPVFIYFESYGILDSSIWLSRFIEDQERNAQDPRVRTINAMFRHVGLDAKDILELGTEETTEMLAMGEVPTPEHVMKDQRRKEERSIKLTSASSDISKKFSKWWSQRRHTIRYHADGDYFRIWVADNLRLDVEIELESRSKGFQWFFSFYLVFLDESHDGHKDAILLLDEPGLQLHPTAQKELIDFFEELSETNQIAYTTHSPFLVDGEHLDRVRPVVEDDSGHSYIPTENWPDDPETIFPLLAAAGYAMFSGLFNHNADLLVEGLADYYYLKALSQKCAAQGRTALPDDMKLTPCGGTKNVGYIASLFLSHEARPCILLDGDDAGRGRQKSLMKDLYVSQRSKVLMLDEVLGRSGQEVEVEDILSESVLLTGLERLLGKPLLLNETDRSAGSLPSQIKAAANRQNLELPVGWKASVALNLIATWAEGGTTLSDDILDRAELLFSKLISAHKNGDSDG